MPLYKLSPIDPTAPAWRASLYAGPIIVRASSEEAARHRAAFRLGQAVRTGGHGVANPWRHVKLVRCERVSDPRFEENGEEQILDPPDYDPPDYD